MSKPTTGPWVAYLGGPGANPSVKSTVGNVHVCSLSTAKPSPVTTGRSLRQAQADARLIAAAPEMLDACVAMVEWDEREKDHAVDFYARMALCDAAFKKVRAAIAKVEGRS